MGSLQAPSSTPNTLLETVNYFSDLDRATEYVASITGRRDWSALPAGARSALSVRRVTREPSHAVASHGPR